MANTKEIYSRTELECIAKYLIGESATQYNKYERRLKEKTKPIDERLKSLYPIEDDYNIAYADLVTALTAYQRIYMAIGMKVGAKLIQQLLLPSDDIAEVPKWML